MRSSKAIAAVARRCIGGTAATGSRRHGCANQGPLHVDARAWAQQRPELARDALSVPPISRLENAPPPSASLESYLKWRGWDMPTIPPDNNDLAASLVSHPLTFPLTLGWLLSTMLRTCMGGDTYGHRTSSSRVRLCCIGARAEAALPDEYWREALVHSSILLDDLEKVDAYITTACASTSIDFIGPDISPLLQSKTVVLDVPWAINRSLEMNFHRQYLHQNIAERCKEAKHDEESFDPASLLSLWDGFVLFNPGIGHPNLAKGWLPTLRYVLKTKRPVLLTAHSRLDSERDWSVLKATMLNLGQEERLRQTTCISSTGVAQLRGRADSDGERNPYKMNPFASRLEYEDPYCDDRDEKNRFVRPNMFSLLLARQ